MVERESDLPEPGDWMTYDVADESIIELRLDDGSLKAFHNVCPHRGRQLISVPDTLSGKVHEVRGTIASRLGTYGSSTLGRLAIGLE